MTFRRILMVTMVIVVRKRRDGKRRDASSERSE